VTNLSNDEALQVDSTGRATLTLRDCSIVTVPATGVTIDRDTAVRMALTAIGSCALGDLGSVSGSYVADDGTKVCYLNPGR
jgi:hypothetical protein